MRSALLALLVTLVGGACAFDGPAEGEVTASAAQVEQVQTPSVSETPEFVAAPTVTDQLESAEPTPPASTTIETDAGQGSQLLFRLAERPGPRHETTGDVPHIQLDAAPNPAVDDELRRRVFLLPGIVEVESTRSLPGAAGLWVSESVQMARGDVLGGSRELAHIHPDGSLHVFLDVEVALEVNRSKWGELHPWVLRDGFWNGVTMVYAPETAEELEVVVQIVVESYNFIVGSDLTAEDIA